MSIYYEDDAVTLLLGDAAIESASLAPQSIQAVVTSPPYFGLRDYGVDGQLGAEASPSEFVANLVSVFEAIRPSLADDGVLWINLGDSYSSGTSGAPPTNTRNKAAAVKRPVSAMPAKNLLGIPWRFAFAMQDAGWILRNDIIWAKPNGMPESVTDRLSTKHEHMFLFAKRARYYFDLNAINVPTTLRAAGNTTENRRQYGGATGTGAGARRFGGNASSTLSEIHETRNPGDVWSVPTSPFPGAHFATFPPELPRRCVLASTREGDTVLDPFSGSGTTGMVANQAGRKYVGIDLNPEYHDLALKTRLAQGALDLGGDA